MGIYLWWFMLGFLPCFMVVAIWVELLQRREWGFWPWKIPLYRKNAEVQAKQAQKDINRLAIHAQLEIDELKHKFPDFI